MTFEIPRGKYEVTEPFSLLRPGYLATFRVGQIIESNGRSALYTKIGAQWVPVVLGSVMEEQASHFKDNTKRVV